MLTKKDLLFLHMSILSLADKGITPSMYMTNKERERYVQMTNDNAYDEEMEQIMLLEITSELLMKSGVRFGYLPEMIN